MTTATSRSRELELASFVMHLDYLQRKSWDYEIEVTQSTSTVRSEIEDCIHLKRGVTGGEMAGYMFLP